ncbi:MAG TPA: hypothetical protein VMR75_02335 [Candidatus Saccharimonadales bacterium]|nr:hypothetical protein [Candidatus Saccharimonadales bacterium]
MRKNGEFIDFDDADHRYFEVPSRLAMSRVWEHIDELLAARARYRKYAYELRSQSNDSSSFGGNPELADALARAGRVHATARELGKFVEPEISEAAAQYLEQF